MEDLRVREGIVIPASDLVERFETPGGPGGQHANRNRTRVELSVDLETCRGLTDGQRARAIQNAPETIVRAATAESRSQWRNRQVARRRLTDLLNTYLAPPPRTRRPTSPTRGAKERRLKAKKQRSRLKRDRGGADWD